MFIVVINPGTHNCSVETYTIKKAALLRFEECHNNPILARVLDVKLTADEEEDECYTT